MIRWQYEFELATGIEDAWQLFSDTDRMNVTSERPRLQVVDEAIAPGRTRRLIFNGNYNFEELPFEWCAPDWFSVRRIYSDSPLKSYRWRTEFEALDGGRTGVTFRLEVEPRSAWLEPVLGFLIRRKISAPIARTVARVIAQLAARGGATAGGFTPVLGPTELRADRLPLLAAALTERGVSAGVAEALLGHIEYSTDIDLMHMAPLGLAADWELSADAVLRAFLYATRDGWLNLHWSLICPSCQGPSSEVDDLSRLSFESHCPSCNISFDASFSRSVQVTFRPAQRLRPVREVYVCIGGPGRTEHIRAAANIGPGETVELVADGPSSEVPMRLRVQATGAAVEMPEPGAWRVDGDQLIREGPGAGLVVRNATEESQRLIYERCEHSGVLTAEALTRHPLFRDLLSDQLIAPGTMIELEPLAFLFTDLKGSTAMYEALGDAGAFAEVQKHFVLLREVLEFHAGTEVKTIGDAIMAVFGEPDQALEAALAMQRAIQRETGLDLKIGLHYGRAMAVTFNRRLDYFGSAVNLAARLEGQSGADEIVFSAELLDDPRVAGAIVGLEPTRDRVQLKGIEAPMTIARLKVDR